MTVHLDTFCLSCRRPYIPSWWGAVECDDCYRKFYGKCRDCGHSQPEDHPCYCTVTVRVDD